MDDGKSNPKPILVKFQRWKDKTKIFYKRKILPANLQIREDLTPKQIHDNAKLEAYAQLVSIHFTLETGNWSGNDLNYYLIGSKRQQNNQMER